MIHVGEEVSRMRIVVGLTLIGGMIASSAYAVDGVLEINQTCASGAGCFAGDTVGFPVQITTPGSYRLTSNLAPPNQNTTLISITAAGVSVDLNGFAIQGTNTFSGSGVAGSCSASGTGIGVSASAFDVAVSNGHVRGMGSHGVSLLTNSRVERVIAEQNCQNGIVVENASLVTASEARRNGAHGISMGATSRAYESVTEFNTLSGIFSQAGGVNVEGCVANGNGGSGMRLGAAGDASFPSLVRSSTASNNGGSGIEFGGINGALTLRNSANLNGGWGVANNSESGMGFDTLTGNAFGPNLSGVRLACILFAGSPSCP